MHEQVVQSLQLIIEQGFQHRCLRGPLCEPLLQELKVLDLLDEQGSAPKDLQDGAHRYEDLHHLQRSGSGSLGNPLR